MNLGERRPGEAIGVPPQLADESAMSGDGLVDVTRTDSSGLHQAGILAEFAGAVTASDEVGSIAVPDASDASEFSRANQSQVVAEQRLQALNKANSVRATASLLKVQIRSGELAVADALDDPRAARIKVGVLIKTWPGVGKVKAHKILNKSGLSYNDRVGGIADDQRAMLEQSIRPISQAKLKRLQAHRPDIGQATEALGVGNSIRQQKSALKRSLRSGQITLESFLAHEDMAGALLQDALAYLPRSSTKHPTHRKIIWGPKTAEKLLAGQKLSPNLVVGKLTLRQLSVLLACLRGYGFDQTLLYTDDSVTTNAN